MNLMYVIYLNFGFCLKYSCLTLKEILFTYFYLFMDEYVILKNRNIFKLDDEKLKVQISAVAT